MIKGSSGNFTREELSHIMAKAENLASTIGMNPRWRRVYEELSQAASNLDAFIARATEVLEKTSDASPTGFVKTGYVPEHLRSVGGATSPWGLRAYTGT